ncbi:hypothetical protein, partial [Campylobacter sp.]|uniref:hypothetical protein n=1 Tax=Campylobacter sp. TaxID=205 RepID=UPI0026DB17CF
SRILAKKTKWGNFWAAAEDLARPGWGETRRAGNFAGGGGREAGGRDLAGEILRGSRKGWNFCGAVAKTLSRVGGNSGARKFEAGRSGDGAAAGILGR